MALNVEEVDLARLAADLKRTFGEKMPSGYLLGKTAFRDAVTTKFGCSSVEAELLVDTLVIRGFLRYQGSLSGAIDGPQPWAVDDRPSIP